MNLLNLRNFCTSIDLQLLLYVVGVAEALIYGLVGITYVCALVAFNKASERLLNESGGDEESQSEEKSVTMGMETEAMIQIFGIVMFFVVSVVMVSGVIETNLRKILPYLLLCIVQIIVIIVFSLFIYQSLFFLIFVTLKLMLFILTYTFYRRLVVEREEILTRKQSESRKSVRWMDEVEGDVKN